MQPSIDCGCVVLLYTDKRSKWRMGSIKDISTFYSSSSSNLTINIEDKFQIEILTFMWIPLESFGILYNVVMCLILCEYIISPCPCNGWWLYNFTTSNHPFEIEPAKLYSMCAFENLFALWAQAIVHGQGLHHLTHIYEGSYCGLWSLSKQLWFRSRHFSKGILVAYIKEFTWLN